MGSQQVFIGFASFYQCFIQGFSKIAISLTAMLKRTGLSIVSAFRVDDNKVVGGSGGAGAGKSIVEQKVSSIICNHREYLKDEEGVHPSLKPQKAGLIAKEASTKVFVDYANFADVFSLDLAFGLPKHTRINDLTIKLVDVNEFIKPSKSLTGAPIFFDRESDGSLWLYVDYRSLNNLTIAMSVSIAGTITIARTVTITITSLILLDKLGKV